MNVIRKKGKDIWTSLGGKPEEFRYIPKNYREQGVKPPSSLENRAIPLCVREGSLKW